MRNVEIERKWLINSFPNGLEMEHSTEMEQGYLNFNNPTVRIRKAETNKETKYYLTIKGAGTLERAEVEFEISKEKYMSLYKMLAAAPVLKRRNNYKLITGETLECNLVDEGEKTQFYYAEVEFETAEEAKRFKAPPFLGREITYETGSTMAEYCKKKAEI